MRRAGARNRHESAGAPVSGGHRERTARLEVERLDPEHLGARQQWTPKHRLLVGEQSPRGFGVAAIERALHAGPASRCSADGENSSATTARCSRPLVALDEALCRWNGSTLVSARFVELRFFTDLSERETAEALKLSISTLKRDWNFAKSVALRSAQIYNCE